MIRPRCCGTSRKTIVIKVVSVVLNKEKVLVMDEAIQSETSIRWREHKKIEK